MLGSIGDSVVSIVTSQQEDPWFDFCDRQRYRARAVQLQVLRHKKT